MFYAIRFHTDIVGTMPALSTIILPTNSIKPYNVKHSLLRDFARLKITSLGAGAMSR